MNNIEDFKSDRINFEVTLYKGCTLHELMWLAAICFTVCITVGGIVFLCVFQRFLIGVAVAIPFGFISMLALARVLGNVKQNKPQGYYQQRIWLWLEDQGLASSPYVRRSGQWSVRRILK